MIPAVPPDRGVPAPALRPAWPSGAVVRRGARRRRMSSFAAGFAAGAGSVFVLSFMKRAGGERRPTGPGPERIRAMKVLVVEDEQRIAQFLKKGLTEKGYAVETRRRRRRGPRADRARRPPDLIILDLLLPGSRDGLELCRELRDARRRARRS